MKEKAKIVEMFGKVPLQTTDHKLMYFLHSFFSMVGYILVGKQTKKLTWQWVRNIMFIF